MLVQLLELNASVEPFQIDEEHYIFKFNVPAKLAGYGINELQIGKGIRFEDYFIDTWKEGTELHWYFYFGKRSSQ